MTLPPPPRTPTPVRVERTRRSSESLLGAARPPPFGESPPPPISLPGRLGSPGLAGRTSAPVLGGRCKIRRTIFCKFRLFFFFGQISCGAEGKTQRRRPPKREPDARPRGPVRRPVSRPTNLWPPNHRRFTAGALVREAVRPVHKLEPAKLVNRVAKLVSRGTWTAGEPVHCPVTRACDRFARRGAAEPARARCCTAETPGPPLR